MSAPPAGRSYALAPRVRWVQDADRIIVADAAGSRGIELRGVEAAVWSWLSLAYPYAWLVEHLALLTGTPAAEAAAHLRGVLDGWLAHGLLVPEAEGEAPAAAAPAAAAGDG